MQLPANVTVARRGLTAIMEAGGEHELRRKLREAGGDDLFVQGMVADLGANGWCATCKRAHSPSMYRLYAQIAKAVDGSAELAAQLAAALEAARPAQDSLLNASNMSRAERRGAVLSWLSRDLGVPEAALLKAIENARAVPHEDSTQPSGNGRSGHDHGGS